MKSGFKRAINWNKYHPKVIVGEQNRYLDFLINPSVQEVHRRFVWTFENNGSRASYTRYYLSLGELKDFNIMTDGRNFFNQPVKDNLITYDNNHKSQLVKELMTQLILYWMMPISKIIVRWNQ